jgi:hypothetical protein
VRLSATSVPGLNSARADTAISLVAYTRIVTARFQKA